MVAIWRTSLLYDGDNELIEDYEVSVCSCGGER